MVTIAYQDFIDGVRDDLKEFIKERWDEKEIKDLDRDEVYDEAFIADSVTGKGSGSYFFNAWKAKESIFNMDEDLMKETISGFGIDMSEHWGGLGIFGRVSPLFCTWSNRHRRTTRGDPRRNRRGNGDFIRFKNKSFKRNKRSEGENKKDGASVLWSVFL